MDHVIAPQAVVESFIEEMKAWELLASRLSKRLASGEISKDDEGTLRKQGIAKIFSKYVATNVSDERLRYHSNGRPPAFLHDPDLDKVIEWKMNEPDAWVITERERGGAALRLIYHLEYIGGGWRICDDRVRVRPDGSTVAYDL